MLFTPVVAAVLALSVTNVLAAPIPQLAGEGAACNSVLSQTDNGVGYGVENAENNIAADISGTHARSRRQLAGEGAACDSVLTQTDNGVGYGVENAELNTAKTISSNNKKAPTAPKAPAVPKSRAVKTRQTDKIATGFQAISNAAGTGKSTSGLTTALDGIDGTSTSAAAQLGVEIGDAEASTLEGVGNAVPKRQLDKISTGAQAISVALGKGKLTAPATTGLNGIDGTSTSAATQLGAEIGDAEAGTLEAAGSSVPR